MQLIEELRKCDIKSFVGDLTMKAKLKTSNVIWFDEKTYFKSISEFNPYWDYKLGKTYTSNNFVNIYTFDRVDLNCDCDVGISVDWVRQSFLFTFALD